jgi:hypothetical protein
MMFSISMKKVLLAVPLAAVLAVSMVFAPAIAAGSYTIVKSFEVEADDDEVEYEVETSAKIPKKADSYINSLPLTVFGYGWLDTSTLATDGVITGVFATIHPAFTDSTHSQGKKWHAHTGLVEPITDSNGNGILCLVLLESPDFSLELDGNELEQELSSADATVTNADAATAFTLQVNPDCPNVEVPLVAILNIQVVPLP